MRLYLKLSAVIGFGLFCNYLLQTELRYRQVAKDMMHPLPEIVELSYGIE